MRTVFEPLVAVAVRWISVASRQTKPTKAWLGAGRTLLPTKKAITLCALKPNSPANKATTHSTHVRS